MNGQTVLFLLLLLACPLIMLLMHRGAGHGSHGGHAGHSAQGGHAGHGCSHGDGDEGPQPSLEELRARRDELDAEIRELEEREASEREPVAR